MAIGGGFCAVAGIVFARPLPRLREAGKADFGGARNCSRRQRQ
ncbi:MAG TPA: hypothetical protein VFK65_21360 [Candidatus Binatia bacterium]|nr:hypothetical protein [Candidatus Binatia bacterium]